MDLKCRKLNCLHNDTYSCTRDEIKVDKNCVCKSFEKAEKLDKKQKQNISKTMFEVAPDMHAYRHIKNVEISCDAHCLFNCNGKCHSNGISVDEEGRSPTCITNIPK